MSKPYNPYAFPVPGSQHNDSESGMSLRDWFAGQVAAGFVASPIAASSLQRMWTNKKIDAPTATARMAYEVADALLKEREKPDGD